MYGIYFLNYIGTILGVNVGYIPTWDAMGSKTNVFLPHLYTTLGRAAEQHWQSLAFSNSCSEAAFETFSWMQFSDDSLCMVVMFDRKEYML